MARRPRTAPNLPPFRLVAPASLTPYKNNPRTHPPAQIEAIKRSIREFGFTLPVLVGSDGVILAGHGRVLAALALGMAEVPVIELAHLTAAQRRAYVIADNQIAQQSGWDDGLLKLELGDLKLEGFDMSLLGFSDLQLTGFLAGKTDGLTDPDEVPEPAAEVVSKPGDVWLLGVYYECPCGARNDLSQLFDRIPGQPLQSEVLRRRVPPSATAKDKVGIQEYPERGRDRKAVESKPGKEKNRPGLYEDRARSAESSGARHGVSSDTSRTDAEASSADGGVSGSEIPDDLRGEGLFGMRDNGKPDHRSHPANVDGRGARGGESPDSLPGVQFTEGAENHPVCPRCARALGVRDRRSKHRIGCGDSTDAAAVTALLAGAKPHLMVTDPPYGVEYDADWRNKAKRPDGKPYGASALGAVSNDDRADWREAWALFPGDVAYVWHGERQIAHMADQLTASGLECRNFIVWAKSNFPISRGHYHPQHETCWYAVRKGKTGHWAGDRKQTTVWEIDKPQKSETGHSTQKPVECMKRPIENNSQPGDAVYDPFTGSGTTCVACTITGRLFFGMELAPQYVDISVRRWQKFSGEIANLAATGETFDEVAARRAAEATVPHEDHVGAQ